MAFFFVFSDSCSKTPVLHRPHFFFSPILCTNLRLEAPPPVCFSCTYGIPSFCHNSSHTFDPKLHHPAMDTLVLSLQRVKATAVFVRSKDCDIVAQVSKGGSRGLDLIFPVLYLTNDFTAVPAGTSTSRLFFPSSCSKKQAYGSTIRNAT